MKQLMIIAGCFLAMLSFAQETERASTALPNVKVLETPLQIPGLNRSRTLRLYLPPGYEKGNERYPVLYMHDAQNLFDDVTSFVGEWGVDEAMNELSTSHGLNVIVVGIDNGQQYRNTELSAWPNERLGGDPEGKAYMDFVVNVVKPYIDKHYRTQSDREHTAIMGSSLGGLISHYGIYAHPEVFSRAGIFSPSYWVSEDVFSFTRENPLPQDSRLYLTVGKKEGPILVEPTEKMYRFILNEGHPADHIIEKTVAEGRHNEQFWGSVFKEAVMWLFQK